MKESRSFIQVISGSRQVGKTTLVQQYLSDSGLTYLYHSADAVLYAEKEWIHTIWERARHKYRTKKLNEFILCIDEIQKIDNWSEYVKKEWEKDSREGFNIKVILLGSSRLLLMEGLNESLAGRFESINMSHWTYLEMRDAFGFSEEEFIWFGGYPGAAALKNDEDRFKDYIREALVETAISKDIFQMSRINKPALLKRLFELSAQYTGRIISYTKLLGQMQDAGNTVTLAHYMDLIDKAGLICGLEKYSSQSFRQRASSPKFQVYNPAIYTCLQTESFEELMGDSEIFGRIVESAIGTHLLASSKEQGYKLYYWRENNREVDFVLQKGKKLIGLEVKSGRRKSLRGLETFEQKFPVHNCLLIGSDTYPWKEFIATDPAELF